MNIAIIIGESNGAYPVPASRGGAITTLVEHIIEKHNEIGDFDMTIMSYHDEEAERLSKKYPKVTFEWVKVPKILKFFDKILFFSYTTLFPQKKAISFKSMFSLLYMIVVCSLRLRHNNYDKVVLQNTILLAWIIKLSKFSGDYFFHFHNVPRVSAGCKDIFLYCKSIWCISEFVASQISSESSAIGIISKERIKIYKNCIDTKHFERKVIPEKVTYYMSKYNLTDNDKIVIFVGRFSEEKGCDKLLEALKYIENENVKILMVGSLIYNDNNAKDSYNEKLHEYAEKYPNRIIFTGYIPQSELPFLYSIANIAVLPSMWDEPAGLTMIEAMSCGLPVITTKSGGIPEYVGNNAILLDRDSDIALEIAHNIDLLCNDVSMCQKFSELGTIHIRSEYNLDVYYSNFCKCLE